MFLRNFHQLFRYFINDRKVRSISLHDVNKSGHLVSETKEERGIGSSFSCRSWLASQRRIRPSVKISPANAALQIFESQREAARLRIASCREVTSDRRRFPTIREIDSQDCLLRGERNYSVDYTVVVDIGHDIAYRSLFSFCRLHRRSLRLSSLLPLFLFSPLSPRLQRYINRVVLRNFVISSCNVR